MKNYKRLKNGSLGLAYLCGSIIVSNFVYETLPVIEHLYTDMQNAERVIDKIAFFGTITTFCGLEFILAGGALLLGWGGLNKMILSIKPKD